MVSTTHDIRILVVDDHALVRGALSARLHRELGFSVVGTASAADEAIEKARELKPNLILMDIDMPGLVCFEAARTITLTAPDVKIVFLSAFLHDWYIEQALEVKARGYLTKRESPEKIVAAVHEIASGGSCFSEEVRSRIVVDSSGVRLAKKSKSRDRKSVV